MRLLLLLTFAAAVPAFAGSVRLSGGRKSEERLRRFVERDEKLAARVKDAVIREERFVAEARESTFRDAIAELPDIPADPRKSALDALPGMKAVGGTACVSLATCEPDMALEVYDARNLPDALRRMIRPWMTLQQARGSEVEVLSAEDLGDAALIVTLRGVKALPLVLNVSPHLTGGFRVWFDRPDETSALYSRERQTILKL